MSDNKFTTTSNDSHRAPKQKRTYDDRLTKNSKLNNFDDDSRGIKKTFVQPFIPGKLRRPIDEIIAECTGQALTSIVIRENGQVSKLDASEHWSREATDAARLLIKFYAFGGTEPEHTAILTSRQLNVVQWQFTKTCHFKNKLVAIKPVHGMSQQWFDGMLATIAKQFPRS